MTNPSDQTKEHEQHVIKKPNESSELSVLQEGTGVSKSGSTKKREPINCLADLLRLIYSGKRNRITPDKKEIDAMRRSVDGGLPEIEDLLILAASDRNLGRTLDLLFICEEKFTLPALVQLTRDFVREILLKHPAFIAAGLANVLLDTETSMVDIDAVSALSAVDHRELQWPDNQERLKKPEADQAKSNAIGCLLLWLRFTDNLPFERIQRLMDRGLWQPSSKKFKSELDKLRTLLSSKEPGSLALAREALVRELNTVYKNFEAAKAAEQKTAANLHTVNTKVEALERELEQSRILQEQLQQRCSDLEQEHGHTLAHKQDAYEKLRSRMSRRLKEEVELLDTGLGALRREPPKVHVMKDHAERAIDGLKKELENLRDGK